jgi:hypothetical protein
VQLPSLTEHLEGHCGSQEVLLVAAVTIAQSTPVFPISSALLPLIFRDA